MAKQTISCRFGQFLMPSLIRRRFVQDSSLVRPLYTGEGRERKKDYYGMWK